MRQAGEPSVEEILDSIKKVIARDNRSVAADERRQRESAGMIERFEEPREPKAEVDEPEEVLDLDEGAEFSEYAEYTEADDDFADEEEAAVDHEAPLVTEDARVSMQHSLEALAMLAEPGARPQIVRSGETSLEGLVRDLLRPALADWLDKNLPPMVERMVAAEISRIIGKRG
jgi:cell pole-organizing protein PopZ